MSVGHSDSESRAGCPGGSNAKGNFVFVLHNLGGGTQKHTSELADRLAKEGVGVLLLQPERPGFAKLSCVTGGRSSFLARIDVKHGLSEAVAILRKLDIIHIHVHHLAGFDPEICRFIALVSQACHVQYDITVHDYFLVCPRIDMIDGSRIYCGSVDLERCEACIQANGSAREIEGKDVSVWRWRDNHRRFAGEARRIFIPDEDVEQHLLPFWPDLPLTLRAHPEDWTDLPGPSFLRTPHEELRVALIGEITERKGSSVLLRCAQDALARRLPIKFVIVGHTDQKKFRALRNVEITGRYEEAELAAFVKAAKAHLAFFPAVWPETYSYTLSHAIRAGLFPVAFDIGAIARRIRALGWGHVLSFDLVSEPAKINDALLAIKPSQRCLQPPQAARHRYDSILTDYYGLDGVTKSPDAEVTAKESVTQPPQ